MPASPYFSEHKRWGQRLVATASMLVLLTAVGCVTVRPEEKEYLAEPAMTWGDESIAKQQEAHVVENREGSIGGENTSGGGCGCN